LTLALAPLPVMAQQQTFIASNGTVNARADLTFGAGSLTITLTNLLAPGAVGNSAQAISDLILTLNGSVGTLGATNASGQLGNVSTTGGVTYTTGSPTRWLGAGGQGTFSATGNTITLEALGGGQPTQMILPFVANGGSYTGANQGVANFDPYVIGPATFTIALSGVSANTRATSAMFSFGTGPETNIQGTLSTTATPEPATIALVGIGLVGVGALRRRRA
jgi:hypothetical protein